MKILLNEISGLAKLLCVFLLVISSCAALSLEHVFGSKEHKAVERFLENNPDKLNKLVTSFNSPDTLAKCISVYLSWEAMIATNQTEYNRGKWIFLSTLLEGTSRARAKLIANGFPQNSLDRLTERYDAQTSQRLGSEAANRLINYTNQCMNITEAAIK